MISVTSDMIFRSVLYSLILGALSGLMYTLAVYVFRLLFRMLVRRDFCEINHMSIRIFRNTADFIFSFSIGVLYLLVLYAFTDGVFNLVSLTALFVGFFSFRGTLRIFLNRIS